MSDYSYRRLLVEIFGAIVAGYITEVLLQSLSWMINLRGLPHIFYVALISALVIEFVSGIKKVYAFGATYFISLIFFGALFGELDSILISVISVIAFLSGFYLRSRD